MKLSSAVAAGLLVAAFDCRSASSQQPPLGQLLSPLQAKTEQLKSLCSISEATDAAEAATLKTYTSPALEKALLSGSAFWSFITDPSTPYLDRMAAANRGASVLTPEELPLLWDALSELQTIPSDVTASPCVYVMSDNLTPQMWFENRVIDTGKPGATTRVVLGHEIQLPRRVIDYPLTAEERDRAPWLWQLRMAIAKLVPNVYRYYGDQSRYPLRVKAAWNWPIRISAYLPGDKDPIPPTSERGNIRIRSDALTVWAPHDSLLVQTILKLATNNDNYDVAYSTHVGDLNAWGQDSYHYEELVHVARIVVLQKTKWEDVAATVAFDTSLMAHSKPNPSGAPHIVPLRTATAILAIGRWAENKTLKPWNRYYSFINPICAIVDDPPFPAHQIRDPNDAQVNQSIAVFESWFEKMKPELERQAAAERPHLQSLASELSTSIE